MNHLNHRGSRNVTSVPKPESRTTQGEHILAHVIVRQRKGAHCSRHNPHKLPGQLPLRMFLICAIPQTCRQSGDQNRIGKIHRVPGILAQARNLALCFCLCLLFLLLFLPAARFGRALCGGLPLQALGLCRSLHLLRFEVWRHGLDVGPVDINQIRGVAVCPLNLAGSRCAAGIR